MPWTASLSNWLDTHCSPWLYPGPKRVFTADEMARGGQQAWPRALDHYSLFNVVMLLAMNSVGQRREHVIPTLVGGLLLTLGALYGARLLWRHPSRARLNLLSYLGCALLWLAVWGVNKTQGRALVLALMPSLGWAFAATLLAWWGLAVYRAEQIEARLRERAEQDAAQRLSIRLASAQIQPHFLFNTLASLQHWVDTQDPRAAPLLRDFTAYLRATLPMFEHELQPLADELELVRRYLAIMQARMGARLQARVEVDAELDAALPPGTLLTLAENAITHGLEPQISGGRLALRARRDGAWLSLSVCDDGCGLAPGWRDGVGLSNTRRRLAQACPGATLTLTDAHPGALASLNLPLKT